MIATQSGDEAVRMQNARDFVGESRPCVTALRTSLNSLVFVHGSDIPRCISTELSGIVACQITSRPARNLLFGGMWNLCK